jgi:type II secretory pathway component GspD/PulD (secretin)
MIHEVRRRGPGFVASLVVALLAGLLAAGVAEAQMDELELDAGMPPETVLSAGGRADAADAGNETGGREPKSLRDYGIPGLDAKVDLDAVAPWDVVQLIEFLAFKGGLNNIVMGKGIGGLTTKLKFKDVTVGDALEVVLSVNNLAYEVKGGIITIMTDAEYRMLHGTGFYDRKQVKVVDLKYADATRVANILAAVKSEIGTVVADPVTGTLILIDTPERIEEMLGVITRADLSTVTRVVPTETRTYVLQYANPEDIQSEVASTLTRDVGNLRVDKRTKTLIVTDLPHNMAKIEDLIEAFDKRSKEVFIEAKIVQVSLNDDFRLGIDWNHLFEMADPRFALNTRISPPLVDARGNVTPPGTGYGALTYRTILAGGDLNVILDALRKVGDTKVLQNPHVAVVDGNEATIKVIRDEPYAEAQLESGTTNVVGETFKFIEVGVSLSVRPRINEDGFISMAIKPEVSTVEGSYQARYTVPIVQKSFAETTVMVKDGETIIIAGMIENRKNKTRSEVPMLGQIPLVGLLFKSQADLLETKETIVFLTPRVIGGDEPVLLMRDVKKPPKPLRAVGRTDGKQLKPIR